MDERAVRAPFSNMMKRAGALSLSDLQIIFLSVAIVLYALFSSPTPDNPGLVEGLIALCLILAVGVRGAVFAFASLHSRAPRWAFIGALYLVYGLSAPLIMTALYGNSIGLALRDIIPFLFLFLPLFFYPHVADRPAVSQFLIGLCVLSGLIFALRALAQASGLGIFQAFFSDELFYFANAPTLLFATLVLIGLAARRVFEGCLLKDYVFALCLIVLALIPVLAMGASLQRATLGAVVIYVTILLALGLWRKPLRTLPYVALIIAALVAFWPYMEGVVFALSQKTELVGLNMRAEETRAIWNHVTAEPISFVFGSGWGAVFNSPAVGDLPVNFSHSLLTSSLLKSGAIGLILLLFYLGGLAAALWQVMRRDIILGLALCAPILINVFVYASFKSFDFGLVLLMVWALYFASKSLANNER